MEYARLALVTFAAAGLAACSAEPAAPTFSDTELSASPDEPMMRTAISMATATRGKDGIWAKPKNSDGEIVEIETAGEPLRLTREQIREANWYYQELQYNPDLANGTMTKVPG